MTKSPIHWVGEKGQIHVTFFNLNAITKPTVSFQNNLWSAKYVGVGMNSFFKHKAKAWFQNIPGSASPQQYGVGDAYTFLEN